MIASSHLHACIPIQMKGWRSRLRAPLSANRLVLMTSKKWSTWSCECLQCPRSNTCYLSLTLHAFVYVKVSVLVTLCRHLRTLFMCALCMQGTTNHDVYCFILAELWFCLFICPDLQCNHLECPFAVFFLKRAFPLCMAAQVCNAWDFHVLRQASTGPKPSLERGACVDRNVDSFIRCIACAAKTSFSQPCSCAGIGIKSGRGWHLCVLH
jgi:hypothetical protein